MEHHCNKFLYRTDFFNYVREDMKFHRGRNRQSNYDYIIQHQT